MVTISDGNLGTAVVMIKGYNLFQLVCVSPESCLWTTLVQTFSKPRHRGVAMVVPDDIVTCNGPATDPTITDEPATDPVSTDPPTAVPDTTSRKFFAFFLNPC
jgi:hypothetical protein